MKLYDNLLWKEAKRDIFAAEKHLTYYINEKKFNTDTPYGFRGYGGDESTGLA